MIVTKAGGEIQYTRVHLLKTIIRVHYFGFMR